MSQSIEKRCVNCGRVYSADSEFCEDDGSTLVEFHPVAPVPAWRKFLPVALIVLAVLSLAAILPKYLMDQVIANLQVDIDTTKLREQMNDVATLKIPVRVTNNSPIGFKIDEIRYSAKLLDVDLTNGEKTLKVDKQVDAKQSVTIEIPGSVPVEELRRRISENKDAPRSTWAKVRPTGSVFGIPITFNEIEIQPSASQAALMDWLGVASKISETTETKDTPPGRVVIKGGGGGNGNKRPKVDIQVGDDDDLRPTRKDKDKGKGKDSDDKDLGDKIREGVKKLPDEIKKKLPGQEQNNLVSPSRE